MNNQKEKDVVRLLNKELPIWMFLKKKEFWEEISVSPKIYISFLTLVFGGASLISTIIEMGEGSVINPYPKLFAFVTLLGVAIYMGASSAFNILRLLQFQKHLQIIQRAQENKD